MRRKIMLAGGFAALVALSATPAFAGYGAFAHDPSTGKYGFSWNEKSQHAADDTARKGCATDKCKVVFRTGPGQCGAIAMIPDGTAWGGATRPKRDAAELAAIENCQKRTGGQCKVKGAECNR
jgi:hypothetical protein